MEWLGAMHFFIFSLGFLLVWRFPIATGTIVLNAGSQITENGPENSFGVDVVNSLVNKFLGLL